MSETIILDKKLETLESKEQDVDPVIRAMYSLPGSDFTQEDVDRYRESVDKFNKGKLIGIVKAGLPDSNSIICIESAKMIQNLPHKQQLESQKLSIEIVKKGLSDRNIYVCLEFAKMIKNLPHEQQLELQELLADIIRKGLLSDIIYARFKYSKMIQFLSEQQQLEIIREHPEWTSVGLYKEDFRVRTKQKKTGPDTFLFDKVLGKEEESLKNKVILRKIPVQSLMAWKKAYESYTFWERQGFDYVPIEPIVKISTLNSKSKIVDVFSGVIDGPSFGDYEEEDLIGGGVATIFRVEIEEKIKKIRKCIKKLGIEHGHDYHGGNFVLLFYKDENGKPDLTRCPRVYLIDFDQASLT